VLSLFLVLLFRVCEITAMEVEFSGSHSPHVPIPGKPPDGHGSKV